MDAGEFLNRRRIGAVEASINRYGERFVEGAAALKKNQTTFSEPISRTRELNLARMEINRFNESRRDAESAKTQAESELFNAKKTVKDLTILIEESNSKAKVQKHDFNKLPKPERHEDTWGHVPMTFERYQYAEVMRELEIVKQELNKLKLDVASVLEEKSRAEKDIETSSLKMWSYSSSADALRREIEEANEEQVLVELARIEAVKELGVMEAQIEKEANDFSFAMEQTREKMKDIIQEIDKAKDLETKLAVTKADVDVLQNELRLVHAMDKRVKRNASLKNSEGSFIRTEGYETSSLLQSITKELESSRKELSSIKEEGFRFMASMDDIRNELKHVAEETARLKKTEEKTDLTVKNLNSKLLRAKSKLEAASAAEEKARSIVSNLTLTLEQLKKEAEAAKKEKKLITEETATIKAEVQKIESEIDSNEEKFQAAMQELEALKSSEAIALENLRVLTENTMTARASASKHSSLITISSFEYEYLTRRAGGAEEIADKKVAAAQAWIEALKASEKETLMKIEMAHREIRELRMEEEREAYRAERSFSAKRKVEGELRNWRQKSQRNRPTKNFQLQVSSPRKSMKENGKLTPVRGAKFRKSGSPGTGKITRTTPYSLKKKRKVMPNLAKLFISKKLEKEP